MLPRNRVSCTYLLPQTTTLAYLPYVRTPLSKHKRQRHKDLLTKTCGVFTLLSPPHSITAQLNDDGWTSTLSGASAQHAIENTAGVRAKGVYLQDCWPHVPASVLDREKGSRERERTHPQVLPTEDQAAAQRGPSFSWETSHTQSRTSPFLLKRVEPHHVKALLLSRSRQPATRPPSPTHSAHSSLEPGFDK